MATGVLREKRPLCEAEVSASKEARVESGVPTLPKEMLGNIACYLPDADLKAFACTDSVNRQVALRERAKRVLDTASKEVYQLRSLPPTMTMTVKRTSPIADYLMFAEDVRREERNGGVPLSIHAGVISTLNQSLTAIATDRLAEEVFSLKQAFLMGIEHQEIGWDDLDMGIQTLQEQLVAEAMIAVITASQNPVKRREAAICYAAGNGHMHVLKTLLANNPSISDHSRKVAIKDAAISGHLEIVKMLEAYGLMCQDFRQTAVRGAAKFGHLEVVKHLLAQGPLEPRFRRDDAFEEAAKNGHLEVAQEIHKHALPPEHGYNGKFDDFCLAADTGLELLKALLDIDPLSLEDLCRLAFGSLFSRRTSEVQEFLDSLVVAEASKSGRLDIVQSVLRSGTISEETRGKGVVEAAKSGCLEIVQLLLESGTISDEDRDEAFRQTAREDIKHLLKPKPSGCIS